jgi:hypothetical protein
MGLVRQFRLETVWISRCVASTYAGYGLCFSYVCSGWGTSYPFGLHGGAVVLADVIFPFCAHIRLLNFALIAVTILLAAVFLDSNTAFMDASVLLQAWCVVPPAGLAF